MKNLTSFVLKSTFVFGLCLLFTNYLQAQCRGVQAGVVNILTDPEPCTAMKQLAANPNLEHFELYPNPTISYVNISYTLSRESVVFVKIFDNTGREVAHLVSGALQYPGTHHLNYNTANLPAGIYYYQLTTNDKQFIGNMLKQ